MNESNGNSSHHRCFDKDMRKKQIIIIGKRYASGFDEKVANLEKNPFVMFCWLFEN